MADVHEAISELLTAFDEYGTGLTLVKHTLGAYDPSTGETTTTTLIPTMGLINSAASAQVASAINSDSSFGGYDLSVIIYHTERPDTSWTVNYKGLSYRVIRVFPYTLQNVDFKYELLIKV